ncbi:unnamed protein product [Caenorhabditis angaria]|uniref:Uncharacterized protein n=1 Tax=Caenorhabditis angaria TaxID=860376 RepID=A0A9P1J3Z7_9PELO|nr:unnamed protein product [Caenorhabditis angaria]
MESSQLEISFELTQESFATVSKTISGSLKRRFEVEVEVEENENEPPSKSLRDFDHYWAEDTVKRVCVVKEKEEKKEEEEEDLSFLDSPDISDEQVMAEMNDEPPLDYDDYHRDFEEQLIQIQVNVELQEEIKIMSAA